MEEQVAENCSNNVRESEKAKAFFPRWSTERCKDGRENSVLLAQNECIICVSIKVSCKHRTMEKRSINHFSSTHIIYFFNFDAVSPYYLYDYCSR